MGQTPNADRLSGALPQASRPVRAAGASARKRMIVISDSEDDQHGNGENQEGDRNEVKNGGGEYKGETADCGCGSTDGQKADTDEGTDSDDRPNKKRKPNTKPPSKSKSKPRLKSTPSLDTETLRSTCTQPRPHSHAQLYHSPSALAGSAHLLLEWFETVREARGMLWRKPWDGSLRMEERGQRAYEVWVSEVMLQQTQVATVIPYWTRWMARWPTIGALAGADVEEVNAAWQGLGYYRRARSLLEGAKKVMANTRGRTQPDESIEGPSKDEAGLNGKADAAATKINLTDDLEPDEIPPGTCHPESTNKTPKPKAKPKPKTRPRAQAQRDEPIDFQGRLPDVVALMEKHIPGVGRYTAGAICSMAYGKRVPINEDVETLIRTYDALLTQVDGNINRLLSRLLAIHLPSDSPQLAKLLWTTTTELLETIPVLREEGIAGDWNQALMELGSRVCRPVAPDCGGCCLREVCRAYAEMQALSELSSEAACTICDPFTPSELDKSGNAISEVTIYPMKKACVKGPREESTAVCVLNWVSDGDEGMAEGQRWLFVKRPEKGLLAGLFEPPSITMPDTTTSGPDRLTLCRDYIRNDLLEDREDTVEMPSTGKGRIALRPGNYLGEYVHVFSHIRMTYHIHLVTIQGGSSPPHIRSGAGKAGEVVWLSEDQVRNANVGTGVKRIWDMVYGKRSVWAAEAGAKESKRIASKGTKGVAKRVVKVEGRSVSAVMKGTKGEVEISKMVVRKTLWMPGMASA